METAKHQIYIRNIKYKFSKKTIGKAIHNIIARWEDVEIKKTVHNTTIQLYYYYYYYYYYYFY